MKEHAIADVKTVIVDGNGSLRRVRQMGQAFGLAQPIDKASFGALLRENKMFRRFRRTALSNPIVDQLVNRVYTILSDRKKPAANVVINRALGVPFADVLDGLPDNRQQVTGR